jgi:hypothetical protein
LPPRSSPTFRNEARHAALSVHRVLLTIQIGYQLLCTEFSYAIPFFACHAPPFSLQLLIPIRIEVSDAKPFL